MRGLRACMYLHVCAYMHTFIQNFYIFSYCACICTCTCIHAYKPQYVFLHICIHSYKLQHVFILCMYMYLYMHTCIQASICFHAVLMLALVVFHVSRFYHMVDNILFTFNAASSDFQQSVLSRLEQLQKSQDVLQAKQELLQAHLQLITPYNPWAALTSSKGSKSGELKDNLLRQYGSPPTCLVSGVVQTKDILVVGAHVWPKSKKEEFSNWKNQIGETICESLDDVSNGILLLEDIEKAFDKQRVTFLCDPFKISLKLLVLDSNLKGVLPKGCSKTYEQLEQCNIGDPRISQGRRPSFKLLAYHATTAVRAAVNKKWISEERKNQLLQSIEPTSPNILSPAKNTE